MEYGAEEGEGEGNLPKLDMLDTFFVFQAPPSSLPAGWPGSITGLIAMHEVDLGSLDDSAAQELTLSR